jgi:hypothetical protein
MPKRYRTLKAKPGELRAYYGKPDRWSGPDVCYAWGPGVSKSDARLLHNVISSDRLELDFPNLGHKFGPSFIAELESRGYDISTLRFSIQMKPR